MSADKKEVTVGVVAQQWHDLLVQQELSRFQLLLLSSSTPQPISVIVEEKKRLETVESQRKQLESNAGEAFVKLLRRTSEIPGTSGLYYETIEALFAFLFRFKTKPMTPNEKAAIRERTLRRRQLENEILAIEEEEKKLLVKNEQGVARRTRRKELERSNQLLSLNNKRETTRQMLKLIDEKEKYKKSSNLAEKWFVEKQLTDLIPNISLIEKDGDTLRVRSGDLDEIVSFALEETFLAIIFRRQNSFPVTLVPRPIPTLRLITEPFSSARLVSSPLYQQLWKLPNVNEYPDWHALLFESFREYLGTTVYQREIGTSTYRVLQFRFDGNALTANFLTGGLPLAQAESSGTLTFAIDGFLKAVTTETQVQTLFVHSGSPDEQILKFGQGGRTRYLRYQRPTLFVPLAQLLPLAIQRIKTMGDVNPLKSATTTAALLQMVGMSGQFQPFFVNVTAEIGLYFTWLRIPQDKTSEDLPCIVVTRPTDLTFAVVRRWTSLRSTFECMKFHVERHALNFSNEELESARQFEPFVRKNADSGYTPKSAWVGEVSYISSDGGCSQLLVSGSALVQTAKTLSTIFDLDYVTLDDAANVGCGRLADETFYKLNSQLNNNPTIMLRVLYVMDKGMPWYSNFGFAPVQGRLAIPALKKLKDVPWGVFHAALLKSMETKDFQDLADVPEHLLAIESLQFVQSCIECKNKSGNECPHLTFKDVIERSSRQMCLNAGRFLNLLTTPILDVINQHLPTAWKMDDASVRELRTYFDHFLRTMIWFRRLDGTGLVLLPRRNQFPCEREVSSAFSQNYRILDHNNFIYNHFNWLIWLYMIRKLLSCTKGDAYAKALQLLSTDDTIYEILFLLFPHVLQNLILEYHHCWRTGDNVGLRVGRWSHAYYGGETRYFVNLVTNHKGLMHGDNPMVQFPFEKTPRSCPALALDRPNKAVPPDDGMRVIDGDKSLSIYFPSFLWDRNRRGAFAFETIGIRYRANRNHPWIPLFQIKRRFQDRRGGIITDEFDISSTSLASLLNLSINHRNTHIHQISSIHLHSKNPTKSLPPYQVVELIMIRRLLCGVRDNDRDKALRFHPLASHQC